MIQLAALLLVVLPVLLSLLVYCYIYHYHKTRRALVSILQLNRTLPRGSSQRIHGEKEIPNGPQLIR